MVGGSLIILAGGEGVVLVILAVREEVSHNIGRGRGGGLVIILTGGEGVPVMILAVRVGGRGRAGWQSRYL